MKEEKVEGGEAATGSVSHENTATRARQLELRAAQMDRGELSLWIGK